jgi:hypothetical protein
MKINASNIETLDFSSLALTFKTSGAIGQMAKLHKSGCSMVRAAKHVSMDAGVKDDVLDLMERGYAVTLCKCAK